MSYSQTEQLLALETALGPDQLLLEKLRGVEAVSSLFHFHLDLLADVHAAVPFERVLGQKMLVRIRRPNGQERLISGICARFRQLAGPTGAVMARYRAELVPHFWLWSKRVQSRIFQQQSVPQILEVVLQGLQVNYSRLTSNYHPRNYCVQYRESDLAFASRLLEEEGIFYYFVHTEKGDELVLIDRQVSVPALPAPDDRIDFAQAAGSPNRELITAWEKAQEVAAGGYVVRDRCFEMPQSSLEARASLNNSVAIGPVQHALKLAGNADLSIYEHPGYFANRFDGIDPGGAERPADLQKLFEENQRTVTLRMEEEAARSVRIEGAGRCAFMLPGQRFHLENQGQIRGEYLILSVEHEARAAGYRSDGDAAEPYYQNRFQCLPAELTYRPPRVTPRPRVEGTVTATVSGHQPGEVFTDKYGRVKVLFHWDRDGHNDGNSSCWVRVMQPWAGQGWGSIQLPRVGQEVVVDFLEGSPDRPIILGGVYNAEQMPPYPLPEKRQVSGLRSRSHLSEDPQHYNEIRLEDVPSQELLHIQAQKDMSTAVEHDHTLTVEHNSTVAVSNDATTSVGSGPLTMNMLNTWNNFEIDKLTRSTVVGVTHDETNGAKIEVSAMKLEAVGVMRVGLATLSAVDWTGLHRVEVVGSPLLPSAATKAETVYGDQTVTVTGKHTVTAGDSYEIIDREKKVEVTGNSKTAITIQSTGGGNIKIEGKRSMDFVGQMVNVFSTGKVPNINIDCRSGAAGAGMGTSIKMTPDRIFLNAPEIVLIGQNTIKLMSNDVEVMAPPADGPGGMPMFEMLPSVRSMFDAGLDAAAVTVGLQGMGLDVTQIAWLLKFV